MPGLGADAAHVDCAERSRVTALPSLRGCVSRGHARVTALRCCAMLPGLRVPTRRGFWGGLQRLRLVERLELQGTDGEGAGLLRGPAGVVAAVEDVP